MLDSTDRHGFFLSVCRDLYFEGGVSSVYLWDLETGFAGVILIKKAGDGSKKIKGCWDSIHVVEVQEKSTGRSAHYKLTSTSMLWLQTNREGSGTMNLGGSLTRQVEQDSPVNDTSPHIANIGRMVEDMENKIRWPHLVFVNCRIDRILRSLFDLPQWLTFCCRNTLNEIYFGKTRDIVNGLRSVQPLSESKQQNILRMELNDALAKKNKQSD